MNEPTLTLMERILKLQNESMMRDLVAQMEYDKLMMNPDNYPQEWTVNEDLSFSICRADGKPFE